MRDKDLPTVIVAGASSGVGQHAKQALAARGWRTD